VWLSARSGGFTLRRPRAPVGRGRSAVAVRVPRRCVYTGLGLPCRLSLARSQEADGRTGLRRRGARLLGGPCGGRVADRCIVARGVPSLAARGSGLLALVGAVGPGGATTAARPPRCRHTRRRPPPPIWISRRSAPGPVRAERSRPCGGGQRRSRTKTRAVGAGYGLYCRANGR
jgi:hypothetical protein